MKQKVGFGRGEKIEGRLDRYVGKYVHLYIQGGLVFAGGLKYVNNYDAILNPFIMTDYSGEKPVKKLLHEDSIVRILDISAIEPTTKENLEALCKYQSDKIEKEPKKDLTE